MNNKNIFFYHTSSKNGYKVIFNEIMIGTEKKEIIFLNGPIGSGKTTFVRSFLESLNYVSFVTSPTFTLVNQYIVSNTNIFHYDLYRVESENDLFNIGIGDYMNQNGIHFFEWPSNFCSILPEPNFIIDFFNLDKSRLLRVSKINYVNE